MTKKQFTEKYGKILLPIVTPYDRQENVDYQNFEKLLEYLIQNDLCDSIIVTGTTGEASLLSFEERAKLFRLAVEVSNGRKPVIAGTGCASTKETIALTREAKQAGIDLCLIVAPFYNKPTQDGLKLHYQKIACSVDVSILLYNIPIFVGVNLEPDTVAELAAIPNIIGIKDEAGINPTQVTDYYLATKSVNPEFVILNGDDVMLLPTIIQGAMGIVSGGAHIFGKEIRAIFECYERGDLGTARELYLDLYRFCKICGQNGRLLPNSIMRPAIELVTGIPVGPARSPLAPITDDERGKLIEVLTSLGKL